MSYDNWLDSADPHLFAEEPPYGPTDDESLEALEPRFDPYEDVAFEIINADRAEQFAGIGA